ncbi:hypothetical protein BOX15_Mlig018010g2, partial [Macrostomum lignano]
NCHTMPGQQSEDAIPVLSRLDLLGNHTAAIESLLTHYSKTFDNSEPAFVARAPGRVNLIGEHIDYCGYSVLPMAIDRHILIAVGYPSNARSNQNERSSSTLRICHIDSSDRPAATVTVEADGVAVDKENLAWHQYVLCGFRGVQDYLLKGGGFPQLDINLMVTGDIPSSSGLSSSSALVVCSALVAMRAYTGSLSLLDRRGMASLCATAERYIGTEGGGMDQAISLCARPGQAMWINFKSGLETRPVNLPPGYSWVVAHCGQVLNKAATDQFNQRVAECRLAARLLSKNTDSANMRLVDAQDALGVTQPGAAADLAAQRLRAEPPYSLAEVAAELSVESSALSAICLTSEAAKRLAGFQLHQRALHVFNEAQRVLDFRDACGRAGSGDNDENLAARLGELMNASHQSCSELYNCSCPELDRLCQICRDVGGALGSRLTGAGWGGCCVSLVPDSGVEKFLSSVRDAFAGPTGLVGGRPFLAFASSPSTGAYLLELN